MKQVYNSVVYMNDKKKLKMNYNTLTILMCIVLTKFEIQFNIIILSNHPYLCKKLT